MKISFKSLFWTINTQNAPFMSKISEFLDMDRCVEAKIVQNRVLKPEFEAFSGALEEGLDNYEAKQGIIVQTGRESFNPNPLTRP